MKLIASKDTSDKYSEVHFYFYKVLNVLSFKKSKHLRKKILVIDEHLKSRKKNY
ncbi:hypothetical protein J1TS1_34930 [Shouchella clausii]|jgi:hypothetical protein|nr:hypothetical protein J1TS1_34930 [Shouchella clausii]SHL63201.1 hypothetical protein SAMN05192535_2914 [Shouchella rhizosphaerae]